MPKKGHHFYIDGVKGLAFRISSSLPFKVKQAMNRSLKDCGLIIKDGIYDKVAHHQHPHGVPAQDLVDSQNKHWFSPKRKKHEFSHEYLGDPMVDVPSGVISGYDWTLPKPGQHYWPYNRLGELAASLGMEIESRPGSLGAMTFSVNTPYATELEFMDAGKYSFLTPTMFERSKLMLDQFKRGLLDVVRAYS